jgi:N-acetyltransferase 10
LIPSICPSNSPPERCGRKQGLIRGRYEIPADKGDWTEAEKQVRAVLVKGEKKSTVVSVKTGKSAPKRKAGETAAEIYEQEVERSKNKKPKKGKR